VKVVSLVAYSVEVWVVMMVALWDQHLVVEKVEYLVAWMVAWMVEKKESL